MTTGYMNGSAPSVEIPVAPPKPRRQSRKVAVQPAPLAGALPVPSALWHGLTHKQVAGWALGAIAALVAAGWITLPAKQSDLNQLASDVKAGFERIEKGFVAIDGRFESLNQQMQGLRADIVRVQTVQDYGASAPASPPTQAVRRKVVKEPAKPPVKATNILGW
jgi:hypothetical protein